MRFSELSNILLKLEEISGRNEMVEILAAFIKKYEDLEELKYSFYIMQGRLVPKYVDLEFNVSRKLVQRALVDYVHPSSNQVLNSESNNAEEEVKKLYGDLGDLGLVAEKLIEMNEKIGDSPQIKQVYSDLESIARYEGKGSQDNKMRSIGKLLLSLDGVSARYVTRVIIGNLRLGLSDKTFLDVLSWATVGDKSMRSQIERAFGAHADIGELAVDILKTSVEELPQMLNEIKLQPGIPVASKLVEREKSSEKVFDRLGECIVQPKLDGLRAQIHMQTDDNGEKKVSIFSRNMESLTDMFPDVIESVKQMKADSLIIDSEAIGYNYEEGQYLPFQETMQRRRKYDVGEMSEAIPMKAMAFDLLYINGRDISETNLEDRISMLRDLVTSSNVTSIDMLESKLMNSEEDLDTYFMNAISEGLEGVIAKKLGTSYEPGTRNYDWIKLKANTQSNMIDTVDAVVIGYYKGRGIRAKFGVGAILVALYDNSDSKFYSVAKIGTGMSDDDLTKIMSDLKTIEIKSKPENVSVEKILYPDVWVEPKIVVEIDADEITRSPSHTSARTIKASFEKELTGKGLSLRFPRLKIWKRDKDAEDSTSVQELIKMYELRKAN